MTCGLRICTACRSHEKDAKQWKRLSICQGSDPGTDNGVRVIIWEAMVVCWRTDDMLPSRKVANDCYCTMLANSCFREADDDAYKKISEM